MNAIKALAAEAKMIPNSEMATERLLRVLMSVTTATEPASDWPLSLGYVISAGEQSVGPLEKEIRRLTSEPLGKGAVHSLGSDLLDGLRRVWSEKQTAKLLYFAIALCYIRSPRIIEPLCLLLERSYMMQIWPRLVRGNLCMFDAFEVVYIAIARALYWVRANTALTRLRQMLNTARRKPTFYLNSLPYVLRAVGFLGTHEDIPSVKCFINFSCPQFDISEKQVRFEAKHALYALRHPKEREIRANSPVDRWRA